MKKESFSMRLKEFSQAGHLPTLLSSFLYFDICFAVWVLNGALAPFISEKYGLTPSQKGFMISLPIISGALLRFPLGLLSEYIGRKSAAMLEMSLIVLALAFGWQFVHGYHGILLIGLFLGLAGASFGVALSLGSGWYDAKHKGLAMGIAAAGNSGTVIATLFGPVLAQKYGIEAVYGFAIVPMAVAMAVLMAFAKEPPQNSDHKNMGGYLKVALEGDSWVFNLLYTVTFGGFIGLTNFLPTFFHDHFGVSKISAGRFTTIVVLMGSSARVIGGYLSDRVGGIKTLKIVLIAVLTGLILCSFLPGIYMTTAILLLVFAGLGAGNGSVFQLVPLRFPFATAVASSLVGAIGALGGGIIPNAMGISQQATGSFAAGFLVFGFIVVSAFFTLQFKEKKWVDSWIGEGGKALLPEEERIIMVPAMEIW